MDWTEFLQGAVEAGDREPVRQAVENGADPGTALCIAVARGDAEMVRLLLECGARVAGERDADSTSVHEAAENGDLDVLRLLLEADGAAALNEFDYISRTPLMCAVRNGHPEAARLLIEAGADVNAHDEARIGDTALGDAVEAGNVEMVELLVRAGANPHVRGWMWLTPMDRARSRRSAEGQRIIQLLEESRQLGVQAATESTVEPQAAAGTQGRRRSGSKPGAVVFPPLRSPD